MTTDHHEPATTDGCKAERIAGMKLARDVVARQTDLTELVHFDKPSDYRKGVLTCLAAIDAAMRAEESR